MILKRIVFILLVIPVTVLFIPYWILTGKDLADITTRKFFY